MSPTDRTGCSAPRHGTYSAYRVGCRCPDARDDWRIYKKRRRQHRDQPGYADPRPSARRVQALMAIGWTVRDIAVRLGWSPTSRNATRISRETRLYRHTATAIAQLYDELSGTPGPSRITERRARQAGYLPPLAWDDIDAGTLADAATSTNADNQVDEIAVVRAINGHPPAKLRRVDRLAAIARLAAHGMPSTDIADRLRCGVDRVRTDRNTLDNQKRRGRREAC